MAGQPQSWLVMDMDVVWAWPNEECRFLVQVQIDAFLTNTEQRRKAISWVLFWLVSVKLS